MRGARRQKQTGFSMIELLLAAFILSIGILGLTMLQVMSMRVNTSSVTAGRALAVANRVMETAAMEGRRSMLWKTEARAPISGLYTYMGQAGIVTRYITNSGVTYDSETAAKSSGEQYYTAKVTSEGLMDAVANGQILGRSTVYTVEVSYVDQVVSEGGSTRNIERVVRLARRVSHG